MLAYSETGSAEKETVLQWVGYTAIGIEVLAVVIIVASLVFVLVRHLWRLVTRRMEGNPYHELKVSLGSRCCWDWKCW